MNPRVSVVIATYNASHLLRYAIESVLRQDVDDWELIVVSDHCTDDTASVVASFADERIRFIDLPENSGQQATPNNRGVEAARGEFLAFLNQDDLHLPDHLSANLACLARTGADIVCSPCALIPPEQSEKLAAREIVAGVDGFEPSGRFDPRTFHVASTWVLRRAAALRVGPWRVERETWVTPSQDWLFRAWRRGARIHCTDHVSCIVLYSGARRDSYRKRESPEHDFLFEEVIASDRLRLELCAAAGAAIEAQRHFFRRRRRRLRRKLQSGRILYFLREVFAPGLGAVVGRLGVHPRTFEMRRWGGRGAFIEELKKFTGAG